MTNIINNILKIYKKKKRLCIIIILAILVIRSFYVIYVYEFKYSTDENNKSIYVKIIEKQKETDEKISYLVEFENRNFLMNIYKNNQEHNIEKYKEKDILKIRGKIVIPEVLNNPYEFNYKRYLNSQNIIGTISVYNAKKVGNNKGINLNILLIFREKLLEKSEEFLDTDEKALFNSIICGIKDYSEDEIQEYFKESGSSHFLSISGTHIVYFLYILELFISRFNKTLKKYIKVIFIILFNLMIGYQVSLIRASFMYIVTSFTQDNKRKNKLVNLLLCAVILMLYNPYVIFNSSFIFSFLSIIGIQILSPLISSYFDVIILKAFGLKYIGCEFNNFSKIKKATYSIMQYIFKNISFVLSVQVTTLPFQMYFFCNVNFVTILSNLILTPLITFEYIIGFLSLILVYIPYVLDTLLLANKTVLSCIIFLVKNLSNLDALKISVVKPDILSILIYYVILSSLLFSKYLYKFFSIPKVKRIKKISRKVTIFLILYIISMYIKILFFEEYVYFFNVGQGNMALLHKQNTNIIVDLGSTSEGIASNVLINFLKAKNIKKIDMIIVTHMHADHMNGVEEVIKNVKVSKVLFSNFENKGETKNSEFEKMVKEEKIAVINIASGDNILYKDFKIYVLTPPQNKIIMSSDILNSNSLCFVISKGEHNYLFMGDATKETEKYIFNNKNYSDEVYDKLNMLDAIQIGHHGSNTSTSELLLQSINPCIAVISSKKKNFGHPSSETLEILDKFKFDVKITELVGAIKIK